MKRLSTIIMALVLALGLTQCKKDQPNPNVTEGETYTINLSVKGNSNAKLDVNTTTGTVDYTTGDQIHVASGGKYVGTLTYNGSLFTGAISNATEGYPLQFYFLGNVTPAETLTSGVTESCSVVISDQTQHLPVISAAPSNENYTASTTDYTAQLLNKCALVKFNVTTSSQAATCITGMKNKVTVSFAENTLAHSQEGDGVITLPAGNGEKWAILLPQEAQEAMGEGSAYSADGNYTGSCGAVPTIYENGYLTVGIEVNVSTSVAPAHEYVDLGLPSGTLWATCNIGADNPEDYGDYFAWGETQPKSYYSWSTYQYCNDDGESYALTKYCNNANYGYNGFTDDLTTLLPGDDAATANWGSDWRMPTNAEWQELLDNTTVTWTQQGGVNGRLFTAANSNSLFLPAAGIRFDGSHVSAGSDGFFLSSSLDTGSPVDACNFRFKSYSAYVSSGNRSDGLSVRAVRVGSQN